MTWSIRARLTAWYSLIVVIVLVTSAVAVALVQDRLGFERLDRELERLMLTLEGVMRTEFGEGLDLQAAADEASTEVVAPDRTLVLMRPEGALLAVWGLPLGSAWHPSIHETRLETVTVSSTRLRALSRSVTYKGHHYIAAVMAPLEGLESEQRELWLALGVGVLIALGVAAIGGWVVGRQSLKPLTDLAEQAASITERDPRVRLQPRNQDDELGRFARAFNALLDRLAATLHGQRQFMADASHELRTPVSVVRTTAQVTLARGTRSELDYRESLTIVEEQSARLTRLVDAMFLLSRAEAQGLTLVREHLYLDDLVEECARAHRVLADERGVSIRTCGNAEVMLLADTTLLKQMVGNLLDNAIRHAKPGGTVTASVTPSSEAITIRIADDGEGIPPAQRERIFERFARFDSRSQGAGLGLPIARWIAEAHGGTLVLESTSASGSCFAVTFFRS
ncbi:MAG TPA: ATP-binding protein, partial [Vicinamibacterales bacterium]|jgi:signal transduction histidine kinase